MRDFFERQSAARRNSLLLVLYFLAAVAVVVTLVSVAIYIMFSFKPVRLNFAATPFNLNWRDWDFWVIAKIGSVVLFLILCGTVYKYSRLRSGGGSMIAETLGGRVIYPDTDDFYERRLLNIIEEMAIASGVTVPSVYLLAEERGINAFAAGFAQEDAVLGVTWGTLHYLNREELQGVIAHEFSHILSGDMLINIRLQGLLHGILVLGLLGETILRAAMTGTDESRDPKNSAAIGIGFGIGIILFILGYTGVFVGRLLKSAISRQREFLADAAAVQFTRNPLGLAGALKKIGGLDDGSRIRSPHAAEISHMYFGNGMAESWFSSFSTHPPLLERIKLLDPEFQGSYAEHIEPITPDREEALAYATFAGHQPGFGSPDTLPAEAPADSLVAGADLRKAMSRPSTAQMELARELIGALPGTVRNAVRNAFGARAVIYGLLLDPGQQVRQQQLAALKNDADPRVWHEFSKLLPDIAALRPELRLPLVDIAVPALKTLSESQYQVFLRNIKTLLESDGKIDLFEYSLQFVLRKHLRTHFGKTRRKLVPVTSLAEIQDEISCVLSQLARYGHDDEKAARKAMMRAVRFFAEDQRKYFNYLAEPLCSLRNFDQALQRLNGASMSLKRQVLAAALECILWDSRITVREAELFRVVTEALDCPVPPWLTQKEANPQGQDVQLSGRLQQE